MVPPPPGARRKPRPDPAKPADPAADGASAPLETYRKKRDPDRTPEPFGGAAAPARPSGTRFVVQQHAARAMHFDFRLEMDGVLVSWAVPKGPSVRAEEKRLAVRVEDHPVEYASFEGVIPTGNYGAGSVIVWDSGTYGSFKPEPITEQYARGLLELEMFGHKLGGRWTLVRTSRSPKEWLLLKKVDSAAADLDSTEEWPRSVVSGLTVAEMADVPAWQADLRARVAKTGAPRRDVRADQVRPMLATLAESPFSRPDWVFEIKYDGVRVIGERRGNEVRLFGRSGEDITTRYPEIATALRGLACDQVVVDGEIVAYDASGKPSFSRLQKRMGLSRPRDVAAAMARVPVRAVFFDCVALEGHDLRGLALLDRKELLARVLAPVGVAQAGGHIAERGEDFFEAASTMGLEGMIAKRAGSSYAGKRSTDWMKVKCQRRQEFVIGGYSDPRRGDRYFGALHVGHYEGDQLVHVTKVGSGFDDALQERLWREMQAMLRAESPFGATGPGNRGNHWVEPRLVCDVRFTEWTNAGGLRHPIFLGMRPDRKPEEVRRETEDAVVPEIEEAPVAKSGRKQEAAEPREVRLSNLRKVFWPGEGLTKGDLIAYYDTVAPLMLPYLRDRPVVLTRYPDGIAGKSFYQKDAPVYIPDWMRTESVYSKESERDVRYFVLDDVESLRYVANLGTIPIHMWSARSGALERPDWLVLDLDPKGAPFSDVVEVARALHDLLDELALPSYPKTSGATGLHILLPLGQRYTHEECRTFARLLAMLGQEARPEISTLARPLHARGGRVYIDWGQNGHGNTIAAPYALRPLPGAPASCPLDWREVNGKLDPARFNLRTLPARFAKRSDPLAGIFGEGIDMGDAVAAIREKLDRGKGAGLSVEIRAGTSGYSFPEWKGNFYPEKLPAKDMLPFYGERFSTVEINNTFYRMPKSDVVREWAAEVPEDFRFAIKASQRITHMRRLKDCAEALEILYRVTAALGPKLGAILFQLPPNLKKDAPRLADFLAARPDQRRVAMEFRNHSWFDDEVFDVLRAAGVALCVADTGEEPVAPLVATADWGYLRLRRETFDDAELSQWAATIRQQPWTDAFVFMKHEEDGRGPKLAARLMEIARA